MPSPAAEVGRDEMGRANECIWPVGLSAVWDYSQLPWIRERWLLLQQGLTECAKHWEYITKQMGKIDQMAVSAALFTMGKPLLEPLTLTR